MRKDPVHTSEDIGKVSLLLMLCRLVGAHGESRGEVLGRSQGICGPVQRVAAVVDGAAGLGRIVNRAEVLPFGGSHFGTGSRRARRTVRKQGDYDSIYFLREEAAQLIEPQGLVHVVGRRRQLLCYLSVYGGCSLCADGMCEEVVERFKVLRQLECGIDLRTR